MPGILIEDKNGVLIYSVSPLSKENTQITDVFITFDDNSDSYANYRAEEDTIESVEFDISATGKKNEVGEDEYSITNIAMRLIAPDDDSDSDQDDYESLCNSLWTEPISFCYAVDINESGDAKNYQAYPQLSSMSDDD
jgi:hypothetical protein